MLEQLLTPCGRRSAKHLAKLRNTPRHDQDPAVARVLALTNFGSHECVRRAPSIVIRTALTIASRRASQPPRVHYSVRSSRAGCRSANARRWAACDARCTSTAIS